MSTQAPKKHTWNLEYFKRINKINYILNTGKKMAAENYKNKEYEDKKISTIKENVTNEFKRIDKRGYRDDQEIWQSGINIINKYIWEMENQKLLVNGKENLYYKQAALKSFKESKNKLTRDYNAAKGLKLTTSAENRSLINDVAQRIDNAENEALRQIKYYCNPRQEQNNAIEASKKGKDSNGKEIRQKPIFQEVQGDNKTYSLEFTDRSDKIPIHEALKGLFKENYIYKIDYSNCKNERIKNKMISLTGTGKCRIEFDEEKKTYLLKDKEGKVISSRALIWNGVRLTRDKLITWDAGNRKKEQLNQLGKIGSAIKSETTPENDEELSRYTKFIPEKLKNKLRELGNTEYRKFIIETEKRLNSILKEGKKLGYELHSTPVSKLYISSGLMEVKFINDTAEKEVTIRKDKSIIGEKLYNLLDGNEDEYLEYLTKRVNNKRIEFEELTKKESLIDSKENEKIKAEERLPINEKNTVLYGLSLLKNFVENHRITEGDSRADNGDKRLSSMTKQIRDLEYTINGKRDVSKADILRTSINDSIKKLSKNWSDYTHHANTYESTFEKILKGTKNEQLSNIRQLSDKEALYDKTESSFIGDEIITGTIVEGEDGKTHIEGGLEVNNEKINEHLKKINDLLHTDINYDNEGKLIITDQMKNIDSLYKVASKDSSGIQLIKKLAEFGMIPQKRLNEKDVKNKGKEIAKKLREQQEIINNSNKYTSEAIKTQEMGEKTRLELKDPKTDEDIKRLQAIEYLEQHPNEAENIHKKTALVLKNTLKYQGVNNIVIKQLAEIFVEEGGGAKGELSNIYNDIIGYGFFDLNDNNAKAAGTIAKEIAITVATIVITQGIGSAACSGLLTTLGKFGSAKVVNSVYQLVNIGKGIQGATGSLKAINSGLKVGSLLIEGTAFNAASKMIRNPLEGKKLFDGININPITKENIQTAAFLGTLSFTNKLAGKIFNKIGATDICVDFSKGLKSYAALAGKKMTEFGTELTGMLAAEQIINITFGHEVIDPETGEIIESHSPTWPTELERGQMIGMILALKTVKPTIWPKIKEKLDNKTIKVCRSRMNQRYLVVPGNKPITMVEAVNNPEIIIKGEELEAKKGEAKIRENKNDNKEKPYKTERAIENDRERAIENDRERAIENDRERAIENDRERAIENDRERAIETERTAENNKGNGQTNESEKRNYNKEFTELNKYFKEISELIESSNNREAIRTYIENKNKYLESNRTLEDSKFIELFGNSGKYGKTEISQRDIGMCYGYTGFELLKKTNYFDALIKTSLKETKNGREIKIPLGDKNGKTIKIKNNEIDKEYEYNKNGKTEKININSKSEYKGFKILEIAYIKSKIIEKGINTAIGEEYKNTGDITLTGELIKSIEGGNTQNFLKTMLGDKIVAEYINVKEYSDKIFDNFNSGELLVNIGVSETMSSYTNGIKKFKINSQECLLIENYNATDSKGNILSENGFKQDQNGKRSRTKNLNDIITINGKQYMAIFPKHVYSIEKCFIDKKTGEKKVRIVNPRYTTVKYDITLEQCKSIFNNRGVACIKTKELFKPEQTQNQQGYKRKEEVKSETKRVNSETKRVNSEKKVDINHNQREWEKKIEDSIIQNREKIKQLDKTPEIEEFMNKSLEFLKKQYGIDDQNLKIKIMNGTEGVDNHYDRNTNKIYFNKNYKGGDRAELFGGIGHELNHYLQEVEIIRNYGKGNEKIDRFVEKIIDEGGDINWIQKYTNEINYDEGISQKAKEYAESYYEAYLGAKNKTIYDENGNIIDHTKYRNLKFEKESFERGDLIRDKYRETVNSINNLKNRGTKSENQEIQTPKTKKEQLENLGFKINEYNENDLIKLNFDYIKIKKLADLGVEINQYNIEEFSKIDLDFKKIEERTKLGIKIDHYYLKEALNLKLDKEKIEKLIKLGVDVSSSSLSLINRTEIDFKKIENLTKIGIKVNAIDIPELMKLETDLEEIKKLIESGIKIESKHLSKNSTYYIDIEKITKYIDAGVEINDRNIEKYNELTLTDEKFNIIKKHGIKDISEIEIISKIDFKISTEKIRDYINRKKEYLEKNRTISEKKFQELFGFKTTEDGKKITGKYGKTEINQDEFGLCYAHTGFEILKKTNGFNEIIQTNLKETKEGREVRLPFCDKNGKWIKVKKEEIDKIYSIESAEMNIINIFSEKGKNQTRTAKINSEGDYLGFKILEIAYIKKHLINKHLADKNKGKLDENGNFELTPKQLDEAEGGLTDIFMNEVLPEERILSLKEIQDIGDIYKHISDGVSDNMKNALFEGFSSGIFKINIGTEKFDTSKINQGKSLTKAKIYNDECVIVNDARIINKGNKKVESRFIETGEGKLADKKNMGISINKDTHQPDIVTNKNGKDVVMFFENHAYSIEKCYIDAKTGEKRVRVINPRHTNLKFDISLDQCKRIFNRNVTYLKVENMFK